MAQVQLTEQEIDLLLEAIPPLPFTQASWQGTSVQKKLWAAKRELRAKDAAKEPTR